MKRKFFKIKSASKFYSFQSSLNLNGHLKITASVITNAKRLIEIEEADSQKDKNFNISKSEDPQFNPRIFSRKHFKSNIRWIKKLSKENQSEPELNNNPDINIEDNEYEISIDQQQNIPMLCVNSIGMYYRNHCRINFKCKVKCIYQVNAVKNGCTHSEIKEELFRHGHPKQRIINKIQRNKKQAQNELIKHYRHFHLNV